METIHYPDEVRKAGDVPNVPAEDKVTERELETAILLVDQLTTKFEPEKYTDEYRTALLELIDSKRTGQETVTAAAKDVASNVTDLMAALQASIDRTKPNKTTTTALKTSTTSITKPKKAAAAPRKKAPSKVKKEA
jgi:DNA end-binding protein Ku